MLAFGRPEAGLSSIYYRPSVCHLTLTAREPSERYVGLGEAVMPNDHEAQYTKNADECRELARNMPRAEDKARLEQMAQAWEELAAEQRFKPK